MTTTTVSPARIDNTSDATFSAWATALGTALAGCGMVQTSDTGQSSWAGLTRSVSVCTAYQIWRMNDTEQATCPIYFKIEVGTGSSLNRPQIALTVGTGTDGAGTITGTTILARTQWGDSSGDTTDRTLYACHQEGAFWLSWNHDGAAGSRTGFGFFRFCDDDGTIRDDGGLLLTQNTISGSTGFSGTQTSAGRIYNRTTAGVVSSAGVTPIPPAATSLVIGSDVQVYEGLVWTDQPRKVFGLCGVRSGDFAPPATHSMSVWGATRTMMAIGAWTANDYAASNLSRLLLVWS